MRKLYLYIDGQVQLVEFDDSEGFWPYIATHPELWYTQMIDDGESETEYRVGMIVPSDEFLSKGKFEEVNMNTLDWKHIDPSLLTASFKSQLLILGVKPDGTCSSW